MWLDFFGPHSRKGITMSELSNRMIRDMQLAGLVEEEIRCRFVFLGKNDELTPNFPQSRSHSGQRLHPALLLEAGLLVLLASGNTVPEFLVTWIAYAS